MSFRQVLKRRWPWLRPWRDEVVYQVKRPYRFWRRSTVGLRGWPELAGGRQWRSLLTPRQHIGLNHGSLAYRYRGMKCIRCPIDLALYLLLIQELQPRTIIEIGTKDGGHAAWLGDMLNVLDIPGKVFSIDIERVRPKYQPVNVFCLQGDENDLGAVKLRWEDLPHPWFVIQDGSHHYAGLMNSLSFLDRYMVRGDYLVVEDGMITELGVDKHRQGGPARAIAEFLRNTGNWRIDAGYCDFFGWNVTANPNGYLVKQ